MNGSRPADWTDTGFVSPRTERKDFLWPAVPPALDAQFFALMFQLERTQWWSRERLEAYQLLQLSALLPHAAKHSSFHKDRLKGLADLPPGGLDASTFADLPITTREEAVEAGRRMEAKRLPDGHGPVTRLTTSGSSGTPMAVTRSRLDGLVAQALTHRGYLWHERDFTLDAVFVARATPETEGQRPAWSQFFQTGRSTLIDIRRPAGEILDRIVAAAPAYLAIWPSLLAELLRLSIGRGVAPFGLKEVRTLGETLPPGLAALCHEVWGARLVDGYSCEEVGPLAVQSPEGRWLVHAEHAIVEALDDVGRPCGPGETGRVVVTNIHNFAMPTIRLELGDRATVGPPSPCGRGLPVLERIDGRVRDLFTLPNGRRIHPSFDETRLTEAAPDLRRYQLRQTEAGSIEALIVAEAPLDAAREAALAAAFDDGFGHSFSYQFTKVDKIEDGDGKPRRWIPNEAAAS